LPPKTEQTLHCDLEGKQRKRYDELRTYYRAVLNERIAKTGMAKSKIHVLEALLRLRQAAIHPGLIDKDSADESSAKLDVLMEQLREVIDEGQVSDVVAKLGPDPLRGDADPSWAWARITKSRRPIGALLMDQTVIAGVGNVYRNELLFRHRIDPYRAGRGIGEAEFGAAWTDLVALMKVGLRRGKIIVVLPEHDHGPPSYRPGRPRTYVYRRAGEACRVCGGPIRTEVLEGRNVFWCPTCQT